MASYGWSQDFRSAPGLITYRGAEAECLSTLSQIPVTWRGYWQLLCDEELGRPLSLVPGE